MLAHGSLERYRLKTEAVAPDKIIRTKKECLPNWDAFSKFVIAFPFPLLLFFLFAAACLQNDVVRVTGYPCFCV